MWISQRVGGAMNIVQLGHNSNPDGSISVCTILLSPEGGWWRRVGDRNTVLRTLLEVNWKSHHSLLAHKTVRERLLIMSLF